MCTGQRAHVPFIVLWGGHTLGPSPQGPKGKQLSYIKHVSTATPCTEEETNQRSSMSRVVGAEPGLRPGSLGPSDVPHRTASKAWGEEDKQWNSLSLGSQGNASCLVLFGPTCRMAGKQGGERWKADPGSNLFLSATGYLGASTQ